MASNDGPWALPQGVVAPVSTPGVSGTKPDPWALPDLTAQTAATMRSNLQAASGLNPDSEAKVNHLARFIGVPADTVRAEPDTTRASASQQIFDANSLVANSPQTAQLLSDQQNMNQLHDDIPNVAATEQSVQQIADQRRLAWAQSVAPEASVFSPATGAPRSRLADLVSAFSSTANNIGAFFERAGNAVLPSTAADQQHSEALSVIAGAQAPQTLPGQFAAGLSYAPFEGLAPLVVAGSSATETERALIDQGADPDAARLAGAASGAVQGLAQFLPLGKLVVGQGAKPLVQSAAAATTKAFLAGAGQSVVGDAATQQILDGVGEDDLGSKYAPSLEKAIESGAFMVGVHVGTGTVHALVDADGNPTPQTQQARVDDAMQSQSQIKTLAEVASAGKFRGRDQDGFHQFVSDVADNTSAPDLYVDARTLATVLDDSGVSGDQLRTQLPDVAAQMREGLQTEGMVRIPLADYATYIAGSPVDEALQPHLRTDPAGMTFAEAQAHSNDQRSELDAETSNLATQRSDDGFADASGKQVEDSIREQLTQANRFPADVNESYTQLASAYYKTTAARLGVLPHELLEQHPLNITADDLGEAGNFGQGEQPTEGVVPAPKVGKGLYSPDSNTISVLKDADLSTVLHELGHHFLETHARIASSENAPSSIRDDLAALLGEPSVPEGSVRVYHSGSKGEGESGRWVSTSRKYAADYRKDLPLFFTDLPAKDPRVNDPDYPDEQGVKRGFTFNFELKPREASTLREVPRDATSPADWLSLSADARRDTHENFARSFEAYLLEGKAPAPELQSLFGRFRSWLVQIYKSVASLRVNLSPDVRAIMDRMLASDETIKQAEAVRGMSALFTEKPTTMSPEEYAAYREMPDQATEHAVDNLQRKSLADMKWLSRAKSAALRAIQAKADGARDAIRDEVTKEVDDLPAFQAKAFLDAERNPTAEHKQAMIDWRNQRDAVPKAERSQWVADHPAPLRARTDLDAWKELRDEHEADLTTAGVEPERVASDMAAWEKENPKPKMGKVLPNLEVVADKFGFNSADEMLESIREAGDRDEAIANTTDQRMLQRHGELADPVSIERAADAAIHNDLRARVIATELRSLTEATGGSPGLLAKAAKEAAESAIAAKTVGNLRVAQYAVAEGKAARAAVKAFKAGDLKEAAIQKRAQLLNNALERAAREARDEITTGLKYQAKFDKSETRKRLDGSFLSRIDEIRGLVDFRKNPPSFNRGKANLQTWADGLRDAGEEPQISEWLAALEAPQSYKTMTVDQFRGTIAAIKSLEFIAKERQRVTVEGKRLNLRDVIDNQLIPKLDERGERFSEQDLKTVPEAKVDGYWAVLTRRLGVHLRLVDADLKPQEFKFNKYDRHEIDGPFRKVLYDPFLESNYRKVDLTKAVTDAATKVGEELGEEWQKSLFEIVPNSILPDPDLGSTNAPVPMKITRGRLLGIARHVGNESNFDKLTKGYGWAAADVWRFLRQNMTADDWRATQAHWDLFDPLWADTVDMVKRIGGAEPAKIPARDFQITTPAGEKIQMRGGYSPIDYDPLRSRLSVSKGEFTLDAGDKVSEMPMYRATTTTNGSLTNRVQGYTDRVSLDFHSSDARIRDTIHDLAYREALMDATKVVNDDAFREKFQKVYGREEFQALTTWLKNTRDMYVQDPRTRGFDKAMSWTTQGVMINGLTFRVSTVLKHGGAAALKSLGYLGNADGAKYFAARLARMGSGHASEDIAAAKEKFAEIRTRALQMDRDYKGSGGSMYESEGLREKGERFGHSMVAWSDLLSAVPTAWAAYDLATTKGIPESMGGTGEPMAEDQAVAYANTIVRQAHGSALEVSRSNFMQAKGAKRFFGVLYGFMNNTYGQMGDLLDKSVSGGHFKNNPAVAARLLSTLIVPALWTAWLKSGGPDDKKQESYAGWAGKAIGGEVAAMVPFVRDCWNILESLTGNGVSEGAIAPIQALTDVLKSGVDVWHEAQGKETRLIQDMSNAIGEWAHIAGLGELGHILQHMRDVADGKKAPDPNPAMEVKKTVM